MAVNFPGTRQPQSTRPPDRHRWAPEARDVGPGCWRPVLPRITFATYVVLLGLFIVIRGLPLDRLWQALWIIAGITAAMAGRPMSNYFRVLRDWSLFFAVLLL